MNDVSMLRETVDRLLGAYFREFPHPVDGKFDGRLWAKLTELGLTTVNLGEDRGGGGGTADDAAEIVRVGAAHAVNLPLAETVWTVPQLGVQSLSPGDTWSFGGGFEDCIDLGAADSGHRLHKVPWAAESTWMAVVAAYNGKDLIVTIPTENCELETTTSNLAGEPQCDVLIPRLKSDHSEVMEEEGIGEKARSLAAIAKAIQMVGAMETVLDLTVKYAAEREQFGVPLSSFQAIQQMVARMAGEFSAAQTAAATAVALSGTSASWRAGAAAKIRVGMAAGKIARVAHQVHGALGTTQEYPLHLYTRRLWAWRDQYGSQQYWSKELGRRVVAGGGVRLWANLTSDFATLEDPGWPVRGSGRTPTPQGVPE